MFSFRFARKLQSATAIVVASLLLVAFILVSHSVFASGNGDGTAPPGSGTVLGTPVPLAESFTTTLNGDYVAAGVGMRGTGPPGGGTITLPALPGGATVQNAFLYWAVMDTGTTPVPSLAQGQINGNPITGTLVASTADPCWATVDSIHNYKADVTGLTVAGANTLTDFASGGTVTDPPILQGASLVVVYAHGASPQKQIVIHEGGITFRDPPPVETTFSTAATDAGTSETTWIVADGQSGGGFTMNKTYVEGTVTATEVLRGDDPGTEFWDTLTQDISTFVTAGTTSVEVGVESTDELGLVDCLTWVAQVLSVPGPPATPTPSPSPSPTPSPTPTPPPPPPPPDGVGGIVEMTVRSPEPLSPETGGSSGLTWLLLALLGSAAVIGTAYAGIRGLR